MKGKQEHYAIWMQVYSKPVHSRPKLFRDHNWEVHKMKRKKDETHKIIKWYSLGGAGLVRALTEYWKKAVNSKIIAMETHA